jgi:hypothetical protein
MTNPLHPPAFELAAVPDHVFGLRQLADIWLGYKAAAEGGQTFHPADFGEEYIRVHAAADAMQQLSDLYSGLERTMAPTPGARETRQFTVSELLGFQASLRDPSSLEHAAHAPRDADVIALIDALLRSEQARALSCAVVDRAAAFLDRATDGEGTRFERPLDPDAERVRTLPGDLARIATLLAHGGVPAETRAADAVLLTDAAEHLTTLYADLDAASNEVDFAQATLAGKDRQFARTLQEIAAVLPPGEGSLVARVRALRALAEQGGAAEVASTPRVQPAAHPPVSAEPSIPTSPRIESV